MKKAVTVLLSFGVFLILSASSAHALPGTDANAVAEPWPEIGPLLESKVRAVQVVGGVIWLGGKFSSAMRGPGDSPR